MQYNYVIVGAGLSGSVLASVLSTDLSKNILLIELRSHVAGNCYDFVGNNGILVHKYGPHIFHTNSDKVWNYLSLYTKWIPYEHRVLAFVQGHCNWHNDRQELSMRLPQEEPQNKLETACTKVCRLNNGVLVPVPFNLSSIRSCFPAKTANMLISKLLEYYSMDSKVPILELRKSDDNILKMLADFVYEKIFLGYTIKQWDMNPEDLDTSVTARIPIHISEDDRYFQDKYQGIPKNGYTKLVENILNKPNIRVLLNTDFLSIQNNIKYDKLFFTGMIDKFYNYRFGKLPYRSLHFDFERVVDTVPYQPVAQVNYPCNNDFTRITEFAHFQKSDNTDIFQSLNSTIIAKEYPFKYNHTSNEIPYYPIPQQKNIDLYNRYRNIAKNDNVIFLGRLADYSYYNMDQAVLNAINIGEQEIILN